MTAMSSLSSVVVMKICYLGMNRECGGEEDEDVEVGEEGLLDLREGGEEGDEGPGEEGVGEEGGEEKDIGEQSSDFHGCSHVTDCSPQRASRLNLTVIRYHYFP